MNFRHAIILAISTTLLGACNFTLAADVTPPPGYVAPTPAPTLGPLYPAHAPDVANGAIIYVEKCAACHGSTGLGDGEQGKQLPVTVAAFALPETAHKASPANWFTTVTQGNLDRFMPPFASLNDQERWDVVAYALTFHTTPEQIEMGKSLFEQNCVSCAKFFSSQETMSALTSDDLVKMIKEGAGDLPPFGSNFTEEEAYAVAAFIRTLTFAPLSAVTANSLTETPSVQVKPLEGAAETQVSSEAIDNLVTTTGKVRGVIDNRSGTAFPPDLKIILRGYDHGSDTNATPQEIVSLENTIKADGTYEFDTEIIERQIFVAEIAVNGLSYQSEFAVVPAGIEELIMPTIVVYATTDDFTALNIDTVDIFFDLANEDTAQIFSVYTITNTADKTIIVRMNDGESVPFIAFPTNATGLGYEATQDSAAFLPTADGFAMPPSETPYGLITFASIPRTKAINISQPALLPIGMLTLYLPEGAQAKGSTLTDNGIQTLQTANFHVYAGGAVSAGDSVDFVLTGKPKDTSVAPNILQNQNLLIGIAALGLTLIFAGLWMFLRDKNKGADFEDEEDEFGDTDSIMDAIITIDDQHRAGKLSDPAYRQRREELKNALKRKA